MTKKRVKISTLIVDDQRTHNDLITDYRNLLIPGLPQEFVPEGLDYDGGPDQPTPVGPIAFDLCLEVQGYKFYCNKVYTYTINRIIGAVIQYC
jgi:hypothetical protein